MQPNFVRKPHTLSPNSVILLVPITLRSPKAANSSPWAHQKISDYVTPKYAFCVYVPFKRAVFCCSLIKRLLIKFILFLDVSSLKDSFWREKYLKFVPRRYKVSMLSSKFKPVSSSDSSPAEFRRVVKSDWILKSSISEETICSTSIFLFWFEKIHQKHFLTIRNISTTSAESSQRPSLNSQFCVEESEQSFPANTILICLMFESLRCSVDFLKRQYMVFITCPPIFYDVPFLLSELTNFWK